LTIEEAELDLQERQWLNYLAGAFLGEVKKTRDTLHLETSVLQNTFIVLAV